MFVCLILSVVWEAASGVGIHLYLQVIVYILFCTYLYLIFCLPAPCCFSVVFVCVPCLNSFNLFNSFLIRLLNWVGSQIPWDPANRPHGCFNLLYCLIRWLGTTRIF